MKEPPRAPGQPPMRDLSFQDALDDPELPFRQFVEKCLALWNRAVEIYKAQGSPNGPAEEGSNVTDWVLGRIEGLEALAEAERLLDEPCEE